MNFISSFATFLLAMAVFSRMNEWIFGNEEVTIALIESTIVALLVLFFSKGDSGGGNELGGDRSDLG